MIYNAASVVFRPFCCFGFNHLKNDIQILVACKVGPEKLHNPNILFKQSCLSGMRTA